MPDLFSEVRALLCQVPRGRVTTYGAVAEALGAVTAARWVASFLLDPTSPVDLPGHRVVLRDGTFGKPLSSDAARKQRRLETEGVVVTNRRVDLAEYVFRAFHCSQPLKRLQREQELLPDRLHLKPPSRKPALIAGIDVSYASRSNAGPVDGVAAYALMEIESRKLVWSTTVRERVTFPYIPGFLAFREIPILLKLLARVRRCRRIADVLMVDGNGVLHRRNAGIASHLGIVTGMPTIGIGKTLSCGAIDLRQPIDARTFPVLFRGTIVAHALQNDSLGKPVFASPGHRIDLPLASALTRRFLHRHRIPEPIYHAHAISREAVRAGDI